MVCFWNLELSTQNRSIRIKKQYNLFSPTRFMKFSKGQALPGLIDNSEHPMIAAYPEKIISWDTWPWRRLIKWPHCSISYPYVLVWPWNIQEIISAMFSRQRSWISVLCSSDFTIQYNSPWFQMILDAIHKVLKPRWADVWSRIDVYIHKYFTVTL